MNIIDRSALALTKSIRRNYSEAASEEVLNYALSLLINTISASIIALITCSLTNHTSQVLMVLFFLLLIRYVSGGIHLNTSLSCCIVSSIVIISLAHIDFSYWFIGFILNFISIVIFFLRTPNGIQHLSTLDPKYYPVLKSIAVLLVFSNFFFQSSLLSAVFITQAVTITKFAFHLKIIIERNWFK